MIAGRVVRAESFRARLVGLLGHSHLAPDEGLWIEPCDSIHTFFMRFPIDVAFVDRDGVVIRRLDSVRPWRATRLYSRARACVELAAGTLERMGVREGSRLGLVAAGEGGVQAGRAEAGSTSAPAGADER